jgi:glucokinase
MTDAHESAPVVGVDVGGTNMQFGIVDADNRIAGRGGAKTDAEQGLDHVVDTICAGVREACRDANVALGDVAAIGVACAGAIDIPSGVILFSPNLGWRDVPLRDRLADRLGRPVVLENDVNGATWGEYHLGAGTGEGDALGVWVGTGIGGGLVVNGRILHGEFFTAGEIGHTIVDPHGEPGRRTIEDHCSRTGMRRIIVDALRERPASLLNELSGGEPSRIGTKEIVTAYQRGDELAVEIVDRAADLLGVAIANVVTLMGMKTIIVGGGITEALGEPFLDRIGASFRANVFPSRSGDANLVMTRLAADSGLLGAALLAREHVASETSASN